MKVLKYKRTRALKIPEWRKPAPWPTFMTPSMYGRYLWWLRVQVCPECGDYHPTLN